MQENNNALIYPKYGVFFIKSMGEFWQGGHFLLLSYKTEALENPDSSSYFNS
jgi:hypothetical protein